MIRRLLAWWRGTEVMCVACGCGYMQRPFHREHGCGSY